MVVIYLIGEPGQIPKRVLLPVSKYRSIDHLLFESGRSSLAQLITGINEADRGDDRDLRGGEPTDLLVIEHAALWNMRQ